MSTSSRYQRHVAWRTGHLVTLKEVYYVPASIGNLLSLLSLLQHGLTVDMCDDGGTIKRGNERLILHKDGPLWNTVLGTNPCTCLDIGSEGKSILEQEHQRLGHIGRSRLFDLAKAGKLRGSVGFTQRPANARSVSEPKSKGTPRMAKRRDCEVVQMALGSISTWRDPWTRRWMATDTCSSGWSGRAA
jgi:hypothetical protein